MAWRRCLPGLRARMSPVEGSSRVCPVGVMWDLNSEALYAHTTQLQAIKRIGFLIAALTAATINFLIPKLAPRDSRDRADQLVKTPAVMTSEGAKEFGDSLKKLYGLDKPLWQQYLTYIWNMMRFDLGYSIVNYPQKVSSRSSARSLDPWGLCRSRRSLAFVLGTVIGALVGWSKTSKYLQGHG